MKNMSRNPSAPEPEPDPQQGISLEELADAFAAVMGKAPRLKTEKDEEPEAEQAEAEESSAAEIEAAAVQTAFAESPPAKSAEDATAEEDACPISPKSIFEAMLFVGNRENRPLTAAKAAELMRDVSPEEIPALVDELNVRYEGENCAYHIVGEGDGYRLTLRKEFYGVRTRLYGRIREARLSQAAIDVLALVAYKQPLTGEQVGKMRGKPSSHILAQLVRRGLLKLERPREKPRTPHYATTQRFMTLFNLETLDDLPRSEEPG
jgi:segregation and condensation protein B